MKQQCYLYLPGVFYGGVGPFYRGYLASQVLGFQDVEGHGRMALSKLMTKIRGLVAEVLAERDVRGRYFQPPSRTFKRFSYYLATERNVHGFVEMTLKALKHTAEGGTVVIIDVKRRSWRQ